jgi:hypothetical protein
LVKDTEQWRQVLNTFVNFQITQKVLASLNERLLDFPEDISNVALLG